MEMAYNDPSVRYCRRTDCGGDENLSIDGRIDATVLARISLLLINFVWA